MAKRVIFVPIFVKNGEPVDEEKDARFAAILCLSALERYFSVVKFRMQILYENAHSDRRKMND